MPRAVFFRPTITVSMPHRPDAEEQVQPGAPAPSPQGWRGSATTGVGPQALRLSNRSHVLNLVRLRQPISRVDLARSTGLTKGTVSNITSDLLREGLLQEISLGQSTGGRPPTLLKLAADRNLLGAVEIRPRLTTLAVASLDGTILRRATIETPEDDPARFLYRCAVQIGGLLRAFLGRHVVGVGMTVPGTVSLDRRRIVEALDLGWRDVDITPSAEALDWPLILENDANAIALAELYFGEANRYKGVLSVVLNDSLGTGIVTDGRLFRGGDGRAGEFGHMLIQPDGEPCPCGRQGCLGMYAAGYGTVHRFKTAHLRQRRREEGPEPVRLVAAEAVPRGVRLRWREETGWPRQYDVYRHDGPEVPLDAAHHLATTVRSDYLDQLTDDATHYYVVVSTDLNGRQSRASDPIAAAPGPARIHIDDSFPGAGLDAYTLHATTPPRVTADGLSCCLDAAESQSVALWRDHLASADVTAVVQPVASGPYDSCGVLVKVQDQQHWYYALLAYGDQLALGHTLSLMRQRGEGDEWLAFYPIRVVLGESYVIRVSTAGEWIRVKAWPASAAEPPGWHLVLRDDTGWEEGGVGFRTFGRGARLQKLFAEESAATGEDVQERGAALHDYAEPILRLILERARQGDEVARRTLAETGRYLGLGLGNMHAALGIRHFRLSGRLAEGWDLLAPAVDAVLHRPNVGEEGRLDVRPSLLGREAGVLGAISVASLPLFDDVQRV